MIDPTLFTPVLHARFIAKVEKTDTCWLWTGAASDLGYGRFAAGSRRWLAHRWSYTYYVGEIPEGLYLDHLCRTPACVNPEHLEPVTPRVNVLRGDTTAARNADRTHCIRGHEFTPENTRVVTTKRGIKERHCRECARWHDRQRARKWVKRNGKRVRREEGGLTPAHPGGVRGTESRGR